MMLGTTQPIETRWDACDEGTLTGFLVSIIKDIKRDMTLQNIGTATADWNTRDRLIFPTQTLREDRALFYFLEQSDNSIVTANQYLLVIAVLISSYGRHETPLEAKYFPGENGLIFGVPVPPLDWNRDVDIEINLLPREFNRGSATVKTLDVVLSYDDDDVRDLSVALS